MIENDKNKVQRNISKSIWLDRGDRDDSGTLFILKNGVLWSSLRQVLYLVQIQDRDRGSIKEPRQIRDQDGGSIKEPQQIRDQDRGSIEEPVRSKIEMKDRSKSPVRSEIEIEDRSKKPDRSRIEN